MKVKISSNIDQVPIFITSINEKAVKQAVSTSIKRTMTGLNSESAKFLKGRRILDTKQAPINTLKRKKFIDSYVNAKTQTPLHEMSGEFILKGWHLSLAYFWPMQGQAQRGPVKIKGNWRTVSYRPTTVMVGGRRHRAGKGFLFSTGKRAIILKRDENNKLTKMYGPRLSVTMEKAGALSVLQAYALSRYSKEFDQNLTYFLGRI